MLPYKQNGAFEHKLFLLLLLKHDFANISLQS